MAEIGSRIDMDLRSDLADSSVVTGHKDQQVDTRQHIEAPDPTGVAGQWAILR